jgi:hypothetical protein
MKFNTLKLLVPFVLLTCTAAHAQKAISPVDDTANLTATMVLRVAFQKGPHLAVKTSVLTDKGTIRIMRASTPTQVCIVKLEREDEPNAVGWGVREKLCWER